MKIVTARAIFNKTTLFATAFVLAASVGVAAVPFLLSKSAHAAAPYNLTATPKCENGLVSFDVTGTNPDNGQPSIWVKSSAAFKLSDAVLAVPGTTVSVPLKTDLASVPASAVTILTSATENGQYAWLSDPSAIASYAAFNCYDTVYVAPNGSDLNTGTTSAKPFATVQKALDTVNSNGTVYLADGSYSGTVNIIKDGVKLIGTTNSRDTVKIYPTALSGQAGIFVNGADDVTIKNLGVYGDNFAVGGSGALIKLNDGSKAVIDNVVVANSSASGININSYSNVYINNVYVAGAVRDGISVVAQQNTTANSSKDIFINGSTISGAGWSAIAFGTAAKNSDGTMNNKSITGVTILNTSTQYGQRGLYVDGAGGTVTSPSSNKLVLQNFYAGDNSNEYINNEQAADIDARGIRINIGNGVVVPVSQMTQAQYDATLLKIKDRDNKNSTSANYGRVQLIDVTAPALTLKTANGTVLANNGTTNQKDVVAEWTKPVGATKFTYKSWTTNGSEWNEANPYIIPNLTGTSQPGSFELGGTYFVQVIAVDAIGNETASNVFAVNYDVTLPVISGVTEGTVYRGEVGGIQITDQNFDQLFINGSPVATQNVGGAVYAPVNAVSGSGPYVLRATDKGGNESTVTFTIDNSVAVTIDEDDINTTVTNPVIAGQINYVVDGAAVAGRTITVTVDDEEYETTTDANGVFTFNATGLGNGAHSVLFGDVEVASFVTTLPGTVNLGTPTTPIPLVTTGDADGDNTPATPTIINPTTFAAILGDTTDNSNAANNAGVEGVSTQNVDKFGSVDSDANKGLFLGLGWYWWLLIIAAVTAIAWWIGAAARKRQSEI